MYRKVKELTKKKKRRPVTVINDNAGNKLTDRKQAQSRWKEYIEELHDKTGKPSRQDGISSSRRRRWSRTRLTV